MKLSRRITEIKPSAAVELDRILTQMRENGEHIISLNAGQPDFQTPENIVEACKAALDEGKTKYTSINGITELRKTVCDKLKKDNNISYEPDEIVITTGAKQALYNTLQVLVDKKDEVIIPTPCWVSYSEMVKLAQGKVVAVKTKDDFHLDLGAIRKAVSRRTRAIIINSPNNPTGVVYTKKELEELVDLAVEKDFFIISDEVYEKLIYDRGKHFSPASFSKEAKAHCITINGLSKAYSMTGWRIGYVASNREISLAICSLQSHLTSNSTTFVQWAAVEALTGKQASVTKMKNEFDKRRNYVFNRLTSIDGITCVKPHGAFYMFPDVSSFFGKKNPEGEVIKNETDLCSFILKDAKVAILPGCAFDMNGHIRLAYATSMSDIKKALDAVEKSLKKLS